MFWRRIDVVGLERLELTTSAAGVTASSTVICVGEGGFRVDHVWELTPDWRTIRVHVEHFGVEGRRVLALERARGRWRVNGESRPDLDGTDEPDLSVTPFCNTLPIRRILGSHHATVTLEVAYVNGKDLTVTRSRQRYDRQRPGYIRYTDLGLFPGFEADLHVDDQGLVLHYQGLFERTNVVA